MSNVLKPFRLKPQMVERVWGSRDLRPWYPVESKAPIGEAWLSGDDCVVETGEQAGKTLAEVTGKFPLLVKMLFPQDKLSVQVHPDDAHAARLGAGTEAKTECWYILQAEPGATVALGLKPGVDVEAVKAAIEGGTLEQLVENLPVAAGDMVYVPAGTIHAIGPGVVILEIQQNSDTTYRLYDYGRPRELHLDKGLSVLKLETEAGLVAPTLVEGGRQLISVPHFTVERFEVHGELSLASTAATQVLIPLDGKGWLLSDEQELELLPGQAVIVSAGAFQLKGKLTGVWCWA